MRTYQAYKFTDEELENLKKRKCWCGKDKSEFQKGMRVYCSPEHREIWRKKVLTWQEFRDMFLRKHGEYCDICGARNDDREARHKKFMEQQNAIQELKPKIEDAIIAQRLLKLEEWYEERFKREIDPRTIQDHEVEEYAKYHNIPLPNVDEMQIAFEVDHKIAIVNGGDEFDVNNLQVLCTECHKKKTKNDLKIAMGKDPTSGNEKEIVINMDNTGRLGKLDEFVEKEEAVK
jgi:5-methylcytosine-specific restriction endonuclease McrA